MLEASAVAVTGSTLPDQTLTCTFSGTNYAGRTKPLITYDLSLLTGGTPTLAVTRTTTGADSTGVFIVRGPAILDHAGIAYNSTTEANVNAALAALNILVRTGPTYTKLSDQYA